MKTFDEIIETLGLKESADILRPSWELSELSFIPEKVFFLEPEFIEDSCEKLQFKQETKQDCLKALEMFKGNVALQRLAWHLYYLLFEIEYSESQVSELINDSKKWPAIPDNLTATPDLFYTIICLSGLPYISKFYKDRQIAQSIFIDTLSDIERYRHRLPGTMWWLIIFLKGGIYRLGRLQFHITQFRSDFHVFRNKKDGKVIMFPGNNLRFRADGQFDGTNEIFDKDAWVSVFKIEDNFILGNPVSPYGFAVKDTMKLPAAEWEEVLKEGDPVLDLHIPAIGPLDHSECGKSFQQALEFFPKYFPGHRSRAFVCVSWMFDLQLEKYLPPDSNLVRFMSEFYLHPVPNGSDYGLFGHVFGRRFDNIDEIPQKTTLHKIVVKHMKSGGRWRDSGCFLLPEDFSWGNKVYRRR